MLVILPSADTVGNGQVPHRSFSSVLPGDVDGHHVTGNIERVQPYATVSSAHPAPVGRPPESA
ncbi:hypothetical protein GCM10011428_70350 [Streptomyces violaceus]